MLNLFFPIKNCNQCNTKTHKEAENAQLEWYKTHYFTMPLCPEWLQMSSRPQPSQKPALRITNTQMPLQQAFRWVELSPPTTGGAVVLVGGGGGGGVWENVVFPVVFFCFSSLYYDSKNAGSRSLCYVVVGRVKREWGKEMLTSSWDVIAEIHYSTFHIMQKRSVEGMSCIAESGVYLLIVCIMLRHLCSPLAQHIRLYSSHNTQEKYGW